MGFTFVELELNYKGEHPFCLSKSSRIVYGIAAERLSNFTVGLTNVSPWTTAPPVVEQGPPCAFYQGSPRLRSTTTIPCDPRSSPGRYLFIRLAGRSYLTLCEVEVFARGI